ncbi:thymidylate kinase [Streptomyces sp. TRM66268-LWL]|uniref:Thymidylate kinase n=1 Tax=Streptomyces polyasparticus TaxID=2767826 RepID=A0ABR7SSF1_9ACTN|nr:thymidylate kinase [Streptomyces polyasparticus]MBC9718430.1 thymidylate kinase [Streptomyces polyasparticus]
MNAVPAPGPLCPEGIRHVSHTPTSPPCTRGPLISVEGTTGVGKTYLTGRAVERLHDKPLLLDGFAARTNERPGLGRALLRGLCEAAQGDPFLRGGTPMAEALLLMAIKRHDLDTVLPDLAGGRTVVEGRSVDSTAVCQAALLHPNDQDAALETAVSLLHLAASYRPLPDLTILVTDDARAAVSRAQQRDRCIFTAEQVLFMQQASLLYERVAATDPGRYRIVDRRHIDEHEAADQIRSWIRTAQTNVRCLREPWQAMGACMCCGHQTAAVTA